MKFVHKKKILKKKILKIEKEFWKFEFEKMFGIDNSTTDWKNELKDYFMACSNISSKKKKKKIKIFQPIFFFQFRK